MSRAHICIVNGNLHGVVDQAERLLAQDGRYFEAAGRIVEIRTDPVTGAVSTALLTQQSLTYRLSESATWTRPKADGESITVDPPQRHASVLSALSEFKYLKRLDGLSPQPYIRPDGTICTKPGYDEDSRVFSSFEPAKYSITESPSIADAKHSLTEIRGLLAGFEFKEDADKSAALAAILAASTRVSMDAAPMIHVAAHVPSSGKSFLCSLISAFASASEPEKLAYPFSDEECRKVLLAALMVSPPVIEFDNLSGDLVAHSSMCTAITSTRLSGRILGESRMANVSTKTMFLSSGNNCGPIDDMARRVSTIRLAPIDEHPENREFISNPLAVMRASRESFVSHALTIVAAYISAGKPQTDVKPMAGFGQWSDMCRHPLIWLGEPDPCATMLMATRDNPSRRTERAVIDAIGDEFGEREFTVSDLVARCGDHQSELRELLAEASKSEDGFTLNNVKLGKWLRRTVGHSGTGNRLVSVDAKRAAKYCIERTETDAETYRRQSQGF